MLPAEVDRMLGNSHSESMLSVPEWDVSAESPSMVGEAGPPPTLSIPPNDVSTSAHALNCKIYRLINWSVDGTEGCGQGSTVYWMVRDTDSRHSLSMPPGDLSANESV
jgi:hypothetical protein